MKTGTLETVRLDMPKADLKILKELAKRMGWIFSTDKSAGLDEAIEDYKAGRVHKAKDTDDLMKQLLS